MTLPTEIRYGGRTYIGVPDEVIDGASRSVAHRRALNDGYLETDAEPGPTDMALALAALVGSGLIEQYRINQLD